MSKKQKTLFETWNIEEKREDYLAKCDVGSPCKEPGDSKRGIPFAVPSPNNVFQPPIQSGNVLPLDASGFEPEAGRTWIYPTNYPIREYQLSIASRALFQNTLVVLPTGLGKTFIAAVVMFNLYRWYPTGKVVFVAPTRPLVAQQIEACASVTAISPEDTTQMTGTNHSEQRKLLWQRKRVFFLTPQVLVNDLVRNICPASRIKCVVLDEAHKALGNHSYCQVIRELCTYTTHFRVLALTATPGSDSQAVKQVLANLLIAHVEIRSEDSDDVHPFTHDRDVEKVVIPLGDTLDDLKSRFLDLIQVYLKRLQGRGAMSQRNPSSLSKFQVLKLREAFAQQPPPSISKQDYGLSMADFSLCISLYHALELLMLHGTRSFYNFLKGIINGDKSIPHARAELMKNFYFEEIMREVKEKYIGEVENATDEVPRQQLKKLCPSHPKLAKLEEIVLEHFKVAGGGEQPSTRVMIFSQYRDSVQEIVQMLSRHEPTLRVMSFLGQAGKTATSAAYTQKLQLQVVSQFRNGTSNVLVATCVGEEGLDIGDVDLIVCYDCPKSPVRMVQRMGRTGRSRKGRIVLLLSEGKEEQMYSSCEYRKKSIQRSMTKGLSFGSLYQQSPIMVPPGCPRPVCVKTLVTVPPRKGPELKKRQKETAFLTEGELEEWKDQFYVPGNEQPLLPPSTIVCLEPGPKVMPARSTPPAKLSLSDWTLWQTTPQRTGRIGHSSATSILVELMAKLSCTSSEPCHLESPANPELGLSQCLATPKPEEIPELTQRKEHSKSGTQLEALSKTRIAFNNMFYRCQVSPYKVAKATVDAEVICIDAAEDPSIDIDPWSSLSVVPYHSKDGLLFRLFGINGRISSLQYDSFRVPPPPSELSSRDHREEDFRALPFTDSATVESKKSTLLRILNKKMKAKLKLKAKELGKEYILNLNKAAWFLPQKLDLNSSSQYDKIQRSNILCNPAKKRNVDLETSSVPYLVSGCSEGVNLSGKSDEPGCPARVNAPDLPDSRDEMDVECLESMSFDLSFNFAANSPEAKENCDSENGSSSPKSVPSLNRKVEDTSLLLDQLATSNYFPLHNLDVSFTQPLKVKKVIFESPSAKTKTNLSLPKSEVSECLSSSLIAAEDSKSRAATKMDKVPENSTQCTMTQLLNLIDLVDSTTQVQKLPKSPIGSKIVSVCSSDEEIAPTPPNNSQRLGRLLGQGCQLTRTWSGHSSPDEFKAKHHLKGNDDQESASVGFVLRDGEDFRENFGSGEDSEKLIFDFSFDSPPLLTDGPVVEPNVFADFKSRDMTGEVDSLEDPERDPCSEDREFKNVKMGLLQQTKPDSSGKGSSIGNLSVCHLTPVLAPIEHIIKASKNVLDDTRMESDVKGMSLSILADKDRLLDQADFKAPIRKNLLFSPCKNTKEIKFVGSSRLGKLSKVKVHVAEDSDDDFKCVKRLNKSSGLIEKKEMTSTRELKNKKETRRWHQFLLTQADASGSESSEEDDSGREGDPEDSFIDDESMCPADDTGLYLRSIKDCIGMPHRYKLKFMRGNDPKPDSQTVEQDSRYALDSFCVEDDLVEFASSEEDGAERKSKGREHGPKRRRRIVTLDSSSSNDDPSPKRSRMIRKPCSEVRRKTNPVSDNETPLRAAVKEGMGSYRRNGMDTPPKEPGKHGRLTTSPFFKNQGVDVNISPSLELRNEREVCVMSVLHSRQTLYSVDDKREASKEEEDDEAVCFDLEEFEEDPSFDGKVCFDLKKNLNEDKFIFVEKDLQSVEVNDRLGFPELKDASPVEADAGSSRLYLEGRSVGGCAGGGASPAMSVLVDSRELASGKPVISLLRTAHGLDPVVMQLPSADYVLGRRLAVERVSESDFQHLQMPPKIVERLRGAADTYEWVVVIVESDARRPRRGFGRAVGNHLPFVLGVCGIPGARLLCSASAAETAHWIARLAQQERKAGLQIDVPARLLPDGRKLFEFYASLPSLSPAVALHLAHHFPSIRRCAQSSVRGLRDAGVPSDRRAKKILDYFRAEYFAT